MKETIEALFNSLSPLFTLLPSNHAYPRLFSILVLVTYLKTTTKRRPYPFHEL